MKKIHIFVVILFLLLCHVNTGIAQSDFEPVINGVANDAVNSSMSKRQIDAISNTMSKASDVYYSAKSSAVETQQTQQTQKTQETRETQKTARCSKLLDILKKIETAFLDAGLNSNNHQ